MPDISRIRSLSPAALRIFKEQAQQKARNGDQNYVRLVAMPELSDIFGGSLPTKPKPNALATAVDYATTPLKWVDKNVTKPFGAIVTSPFTPDVPGTEGMNWLEKERTQYEQWKEPEFTMPWGGKFRPTKGIVESLPWLAVPSAGGVVGKLAGLAAKGGAIGKAAGIAGKVLSPVAAAEALPAKVVSKILGGKASKVFYRGESGAQFKERGKITFYTADKEYASKFGKVSEHTLSPKNPLQITDDLTIEMLGGNKTDLKPLTKVFNNKSSVRTLLLEGNPKVDDYIANLASKSGYDSLYIPSSGKIVGKDFVGEQIAILNTPEVALGKLTGLVKEATAVLPEQRILHSQQLAQKKAKALEAMGKAKGEQSFVNFTRALTGELDDVAFDPVGNKLSQQEWDEVFDLAKSNPLVAGFDYATINTAITKIKKGILPFESELKVLEKAYGSELTGELVKKMRPNRFNQAMDIANAPRTALSTFDMSYPARQGALLWSRHPLEQSKTIAPMVKAFFSDANAELTDSIIKSRTYSAEAMRYMEFTPIPSKTSLSVGSREEAFGSRLIEKIPGLGAIVRASNRAFVTAANDMRSRAWEISYPEFVRMGGTEADFKGLGNYIMAASGRGNLPKAIERAGPLLNATLFAPRLLWSRGEVVAGLASSSPLVRKEAAKTIGSFLGLGSTLVGLAVAGGAKTELDPRSSDFGKIRVGDTRLDIWSGYTQWARLAAQVTTGQKKTAGGNVLETNRKESWDRFWQSKLSPAAGLLNDILKGESYMGDEVNLTTDSLREQAVSRLAPLFVQDLVDAMFQEGVVEGMIALPGFFGVGVSTYMNPVKKMQEELAQKKYGMSWEEVGKTMGNAAQRQLENENPQLTAVAKQQDEKYAKSIAGKADPNSNYRIETGLIEDRYQNSITLASQEFKDTGDGTNFREKVNNAAMNRREQYNLINMNPNYAQVTDYYKKPLDQKQISRMNEADIARRAYNTLMYSDEMYDQYGNYRFDQIDQNKQSFIAQFGLQALKEVEDYYNITAKDTTPEYEALKQAQSILRPYFDIETQIWSQYPQDMEQAAKEIEIIGRTDKYKERQMLSKYPQIVYIRKMIAYEKLRLKAQNPQMQQALSMFYSYG